MGVAKLGSSVEFVDYMHTGMDWDELKRLIGDASNGTFSLMSLVDNDTMEPYGWEIRVDTDDIDDVRELWNKLGLIGDPSGLDYIVFYIED